MSTGTEQRGFRTGGPLSPQYRMPYGRIPGGDDIEDNVNDFTDRYDRNDARPRTQPRPRPVNAKPTFQIDERVTIHLDYHFARRLGEHIIDQAGTEDKQIMALAYQLANMGTPTG